MLSGSKSSITKRIRRRSLPKVPRVTITPSDLAPLGLEDDYDYSLIPSSYLNKAADISHSVDVPRVDSGKGEGSGSVEGMSYWRAPSVDGPYIDIEDQLSDLSCTGFQTFRPSPHGSGSGDDVFDADGAGISYKSAPGVDNNSYVDIDQTSGQTSSQTQTFPPCPHGGGKGGSGSANVIDGGGRSYKSAAPDVDNSYVDIDQLNDQSGSVLKITSTRGSGGTVRGSGNGGNGGGGSSYKSAPDVDNSYVDIDQLSNQPGNGPKSTSTLGSGGKDGRSSGSSGIGGDRVPYKSAPGEDYSYVDIDQLSNQTGSGVQTVPTQYRERPNPALKWHTLPQPQIPYDEDIRLPVRTAAHDQSLDTVSPPL